jgi:1-acyl-sn-glycerol-3-phosphate acyltransferase
MELKIKYPRNLLVRKSFQWLGKILLKLLTKVQVYGMVNYPRSGRLIVVANHTGVIETVLMTCFAPRTIEYMGSVDLPHEPQLAAFMNAYKFIPIYRGNVSINSMRMGLDILNQDGVIGIFPEGGIWEPAIRKAQAGVAWLSHHGNAPVLPIGFSSTAGALPKALAFKRPELVMTIGDIIPPVEISPGLPKKDQLQQAAQHIMDTVWELLPEKERAQYDQLDYENFALEVMVTSPTGEKADIPPELEVSNGTQFSKILYRTTLINNFRINLKIDIEPLKIIDKSPPPQDIVSSTKAILQYLDNENPYYFTYRYGQKEGSAMQNSIQEIHDLAQWVATKGYTLKIIPKRIYSLTGSQQEFVEYRPKELDKW